VLLLLLGYLARFDRRKCFYRKQAAYQTRGSRGPQAGRDVFRENRG
jgi:hypothetical protein